MLDVRNSQLRDQLMVFDKVKDLSDMGSLNPGSKELGVWISLANWQDFVAAQEMAIKDRTVLI